MKKTIFNFIVILYVICAIIVTIFLLSYNDYKVTEIGDYTFIIISSDEISEDYKKGNLVIVNGARKKEIAKGDKIFFYKDNAIKYGEVKDIHEYDSSENTYIMDGNYQLTAIDIIGSSKDAKSIEKLGGILRIVESKWGFLFIIIFPSLIAFFREILALVIELKEE